MKSCEDNIYHFVDARAVPDPIHPYSSDLAGLPIIIDNGSYQSRVGWSTDTEPRLQFRNCYAKYRKDRGKKIPATTELLVGNDISNMEAVRFQLKTPHDENVVTHYQAQELLLDYAFSHLGLSDSGGVPHPVVMTEPLLNPNYCRGLMSELLFECYNIPQVAYCVDGLASYYYNQADLTPGQEPTLRDGLLLNLGHHSTHVIPILRGWADTGRAKRVRVGGGGMTRYLWRWLQLQHSQHAGAITLARAEELVQTRLRIARDFPAELRLWADPEHCRAHALRVQLPYAVPGVSGVDPAAQRERRQEAAKRLIRLNARKREEKLVEAEGELARLSELRDALTEFSPWQPEYRQALEEAGVGGESELDARIAELEQRIQRGRAKLRQERDGGVEGEVERCSPSPAVPAPPSAAGLVELQREWGDIQRQRAARRNRRQEMAKRRTAASQERMRLISQLAKREKKEDNFGRRDEDWDVYKAINKEGGGSDSEEEAERLSELESLLRQHSPHFLAEQVVGGTAGDQASQLTPAQRHQLPLTTELIRTGELVFQPSVIGLEQGGLADTVQYVLSQYDTEDQRRLTSHVFLTGGPANMPGLKERMEDELMAMRPFKETLNVVMAKDPSLDAWRGCRAAAADVLHVTGISRQQYEEQGGERLLHYCLGNKFWASFTPPELADEGKQEPDSDTAAPGADPAATASTAAESEENDGSGLVMEAADAEEVEQRL